MIKLSLIRHLQGTVYSHFIFEHTYTYMSLQKGELEPGLCDSFVCISFICKFTNRFKGRKWVKWSTDEDNHPFCTHLWSRPYQKRSFPPLKLAEQLKRDASSLWSWSLYCINEMQTKWPSERRNPLYNLSISSTDLATSGIDSNDEARNWLFHIEKWTDILNRMALLIIDF